MQNKKYTLDITKELPCMMWSKEPTKYNFNKRCGMDFLITNFEF